MFKIVALNAEDTSDERSDDDEAPLITKEAQEDLAVAQYKEALGLQRDGKLQESADKLQDVLHMPLVQDVEKSDMQQYQPLLALKYSCLKNLGTLDLKAGNDAKAFDFFLEALQLDDTDTALLYKVGCLAEKLENFDIACASFYEGLQINPNHWLCIDRLITLLYAMNSYLPCLSFVAKGLQMDPEYTKCIVMRDILLEESPCLSQYYQDVCPDLPLAMEGKADKQTIKEITEEAIEIREKWYASRKLRVRGSLGLTRPINTLTWLSVAEELMRLFKYIKADGVDANCDQKIDLDKVEDIQDTSPFDDRVEEMEIDDGEDSNKKQGEEDETSASGSKKHRKRLFLENWVLGGQRRSARVRTTTRKDDDTPIADSLKRLIPMSLLPDSLKDSSTRLMLEENSMDTMDMFKIFEEKQQVSKVSSRRPSANTAASIAENIAKEDYFNTENEQKEVIKYLEEHKDNWGIFNLVTDFVKLLAAKSALTWPHKLVTLWIECYQVMRQSLIHVNPLSGEQSSEELEEDGRLSLLHAELLTDRLQKQKKGTPSGVLLDDVTQLQMMSCWSAEEALRINWIRAHLSVKQKDTETACSFFRAIINQLEDFPEGVQLINCKNVICQEDATAILSSLECSQSLVGAELFWKEGQWKRLAELIEGSFQVQTRNDFRHIQLEMFADALVRIDEPSRCFGWLEISLHEAVGHYLTNQLPQWAKCIEKLLGAAVYLLQEYGVDATISSLPSGRLSRFFQDICQIVCAQLETNEMVMPIETVDSWILLQQILAHEEKNKTPGEMFVPVDEEEADGIPASISVLFVAHEHLGRRSWCCAEEGSLLLFALEQIIPRLRSAEFASFRSKLTPYIEQMFFCLYEYPTTKRPKGKAMQEHNVPHVDLTFESAQLLLDFYRPDELPEFDSYRVGSITADAEALIKKIIGLAPEEYNPQKTLENLRLYVEGKVDKMPTMEHTPLPAGLRNINYLLADFYFKNNELPKAVKYYMLDLCHNPSRLDAWAGMALARGSQLETQMNSCCAINETDFIKRAEKAEMCFEKVLQLSGGRHTVICIEFGSFVYMLHSFCSRLLKQATDTLSMEQFELLEAKKATSLDTAESCFQKAMAAWKQNSEEDQDERWLHHYMLGKASEKRHQQPWRALEEYRESARLLQEHKLAFPPKINYTNPSELSIEALEVHYRIHSCLLKHLESHEGRTLPDEQQVRKILQEQRRGPFGPDWEDPSLKRKAETEPEEASKKPRTDDTSAAVDNEEPLRRVSQESSTTVTSTTTTTSTSSSSSSSDDSSSSSSDDVKEKAAEPVVEPDQKEVQFDPLKDHAELIGLCLEALVECSVRFPEHYKPHYRLAHYYFKSKLHKDLEKSKELLLGPHTNPKLHGLFQDRKPSNFFNGVWRIPVNEIDRPGCFASHMSRSLILAMELVKETKDYRMLIELSLQLKRTPDPDKKYLRDNERKDLSEQAVLLSAQVLRQIMKEAKPEDLTNLIIEIYKLLQKVQRTQINKEPHAFGRLLCDAYSLLQTGKIDSKATPLDVATKFAQQELARIKYAAKAAERAEKAAEIGSMVSNSSASVSETQQSIPAPSAPAPSIPPMMPQIRKPPTVGTSRRGRPPLSRPPGSMTGRGRAKSNPYANYFNSPYAKSLYGNLDATSLNFLQSEFMLQMMQSYTASMPGMGGVGVAPTSPMSSMPGITPMVSTPPAPPAHSLQKITKSRPNLSVTPIVSPKLTPPKHNTNKTVKKLLEQSRKMLETAGRMQQQPRKMSPLPQFPPGIVASIAKPSSTSTPMTMAGPSPAKKPLLSQSSPLTFTKVPSAGGNSPMSLVTQQRSSPVEIIKKPSMPKMPPPRPSLPQHWPSSIPKHMQRAMHTKKQPPPHLQAPGGPRQMGSPGSSKPQPAHMASRAHAYPTAKDFHFPSDISVMPTSSVIQHTKQHQQFEQFNLPASISVSPATKPSQPPKVQLPKEQPKRKTSDDVIVLD